MPKDGDDGFFPTTGNELVSIFHQLGLLILQNYISANNLFFYQKPEAVTSSRKYRVRVLVCAPSNSALDEIVLRVRNAGAKFLLPFLIYLLLCKATTGTLSFCQGSNIVGPVVPAPWPTLGLVDIGLGFGPLFDFISQLLAVSVFII